MGIFDTEAAHEDPNSLDVGFYGYIKNGWSNMLKSTFGKIVDNVFVAATTGVGKGILLTLGGIMVGGVALGGLAGHAKELMPLLNVPVGSNLVDGMVNGAYHAAKYALTDGIGYLAIGAVVGGVADIRSFKYDKEAQDAAARVAAHKAAQEQAIAKQQQVSVNTPSQEFDAFQPQTGWAERTTNHSRNEGHGR